MLNRRLLALLACLLLATPAFGTAGTQDLGKIDFPTSGKATAQEHFLRGVLWLHSFEYRDARASFQKAQEADPGFAMAYWGEAMTYNHPIWLEEDINAAREALERLAPTPEERAAKAVTEREKGYLRAVEILFSEGDKKRRDHAYAEAMRELSERFSEDLEARSFYALAILGTCHEGRDIPTYIRAAAVAGDVFAVNPEHPGAAHYIIHSFDDPVHAPLGLRAAHIYAKIAPAAEHALHMPSHIFLALGMWDETVASNIDSWEAGEARVARDNLPSDRRNYHALYWLHYAYLQQGHFDKARELLEIMRKDQESSGSERARSHYAFMRSAYLVETEQWDAVPVRPDLEGLPARAYGMELFAHGMGALRAGRPDEARAVLEELERRVAATKTGTSSSRGSYTRVGPPRTERAEIMTLELKALIRLDEGKTDEALALLEEATARESALPSGFGPVIPVKPSFELYGEVLLELGRPDEARAAFETALERAPRRARSVLGLMRASKKGG